MSVSTEAHIYISGSVPGTDERRLLSIDPLPIGHDGEVSVTVNAGAFGCIVSIPDLREALDRAERIQKEDGQ